MNRSPFARTQQLGGRVMRRNSGLGDIDFGAIFSSAVQTIENITNPRGSSTSLPGGVVVSTPNRTTGQYLPLPGQLPTWVGPAVLIGGILWLATRKK